MIDTYGKNNPDYVILDKNVPHITYKLLCFVYVCLRIVMSDILFYQMLCTFCSSMISGLKI